MNEDVKIPLPGSLQEIVGSLLFSSPDPLTATEIREAIRGVETEAGETAEIMDVYRTCTGKEIDAALRGLEKALEVAGCGFQLVCTGGTYRLQTVASCGRYVRALLKLDRPNRLGRASLETLAIIAYRQPITRSEIEDIRGVDVSGNIKILMDLQLIRLVGKSELPGHPFLYGTTPLFLEHFGLANLAALNELDPTLQRSNPKKRAEAYRRKDAPPAEKPEAVADKGADAPDAEKPATPDAENPATPDAEIPGAADKGDPSAEEGAFAGADDDFFIDDTPDEYDEDDEDSEEEEDEEEGGEDGEE